MAVGQNRFIVVDTAYVRNSEYGKRSFCGRCFTTSEKAPYGKVVEVFDADGAKQFFGCKKPNGTDTDEYAFAKKYFSYRTNDGRSPYKLSFSRWTPVNTNGWIKSVKTCPGWGELRKVGSYADYILEINTTRNKIILNLSGLMNCVCLTGQTIANSLVNILNSQMSSSGLPDFFRGATASIESGSLRIDFPSGQLGDVANKEIVLPCTGGRIADVLGLTEESGVICSNFAIGEDPLAAVSRVASENDDFGSFMFFDWMSSYGAEVLPNLRIQRILKIAEWNHNQNYKYMFVEALPSSWDEDGTSINTVNVQDKVSSDLRGTAICSFKSSGKTEDMDGYRYEEFLPMAILAATDFESKEATQNYMFQQCDAADITFDGDYVASNEKAITDANINIYGEVQSVGVKRAFLMPGKMLNGEDMSVYACEMFVKESISTWLINHFIGKEIVRLAAGEILSVAVGIDGIVKSAKENGIVTDGYALDSTKRMYVNSVIGSEKGYDEFEKDGYCISVFQTTSGGKAALKYVLVYNKHGQIRKIEGLHVINVLQVGNT